MTTTNYKQAKVTARLKKSHYQTYQIWLQPLDSAIGQPFMGTSAANVSIYSYIGIVDQVRSNVENKYTHLSRVDPAYLRVYKNKAALDANDDPLDDAYCLTELTLGQSEKDAVVIVIPSLESNKNGLLLSQQPIRFNSEIDVSCCKLSTEFLKGVGLHSYCSAATSCAKNSKVTELLNQLADYDVLDKKLCRFTCIIAPSGTGKTQLAVTAAAANKNVMYFYTGLGDNGLVQDFYKPHIELRNELLKLTRDLREIVRSMCGTWARDCSYLFEVFCNREHAVFGLLYKCFFGSPSRCAVTLGDLRDRIFNEGKRFLVFLDEIPTISDDAFYTVMLLRNLFRAVGVSPILMSSNSRSITMFHSGTNTRGSGEPVAWCRIVVNLPEYHTDDIVFDKNPWLVRSERPLVADIMVNLMEKTNLSIIVDEVQKRLQQLKPKAWLDTPGLQLCQLLPSKTLDVNCLWNDNIIASHFACISIPGEPFVIDQFETMRWSERQCVEFVNPEKEPILFLALMTWKMAHIQEDPDRYFPLVEETGLENQWQSLSIREALNVSSDFFTMPVRMTSDSTIGDGVDLEALALSSITFASLQSDNGVFQGVELPQFLSSVFHFICLQDLNAVNIGVTTNKIQELLKNTPFAAVAIPTCPCADSSFTKVWSGHKIPSFLSGQVKRHPDEQRRDSVVQSGMNEILHVECKNRLGIFTTKVLEDIVEQMRLRQCKVSIYFTTDLVKSLVAEHGGWQNVTEKLGIHNHSICFLVLEDGKSPVWLTIEQGTILTMDCQIETEYLVVIVATGTMAPA